jgi:flagellar biosynthesis protein FlhG
MVDQANSLREIVKREKEIKENQKLKIIIEDEKERKELASRIRAVYDDTIIISMPAMDNYLIPLENLSSIKVIINGNDGDISFFAKILERKFTPVPILVITHPNHFRGINVSKNRSSRVVAITSGKGGVGKTNISVNLAIALSQMGKRIVVFDADLGLANIDVALGLKPKYSVADLIKNNKKMRDIIYDGPMGIKLIAAGSGVDELLNMKDWELNRFIMGLSELEDMADIILIDTGAGISNKVTNFLFASDEIIIVTTPEPTSITDSYALIKVIVRNEKNKDIKLLINRAENEKEAQKTADKLRLVCDRFLNIKLNVIGYILEDKNISKAIKEQKALVVNYPNSEASQGIRKIAQYLVESRNQKEDNNYSNLNGFIRRLRSLFS